MKNTVFLTQKNHSAVKGDKYSRALTINLESKHSRLLTNRKLKSVTCLSIANTSGLENQVYNTLRLHTNRFSKTVKRLSIASDDSRIRIKEFSRVLHATLDLEPNSPTSPTDDTQRGFSFDRITCLGKLKSLTINLFKWEQLWRLSRFRDLESLYATSTLKDISKVSDKDFQNPKASSIKYFITISSSEYNTTVELPTKLLERVRSLTLPSSSTDIPIIGSQAHQLMGMKAFSCNLSSAFLKSNSTGLEKLSYLRQLDRLSLDFSMNSQSTSEFLDHVVFPMGITQLKLTFSNCKYTALENATFSLAYFQSLNTLKNLSVFEFEAFRLSLFKESKSTCVNFIKNTLKSLDCQLSSLSLKAPAATQPDDEFYELILSHSTLRHIELGIPVSASPDIVNKIKEFKGELRSLKLSNNSILFDAIPRENLLNLEELSIYLGIHTDSADDEKNFQAKYVNMLKKIKSLKNIETLNLYNSIGVSKNKKKVLKGLRTIMRSVKGLKTISVGMRSMKIADYEKCGLESVSTQKKFLFSNFKFSNVEFGTA